MNGLLKQNKIWLLIGVILLLTSISGGVRSLAASNPQESIQALEEDLIQASEEVTPAVVNIRTIQLTGEFFFNVVPREGQGSGVIFDKEGYILTNEHVVHNAKEIKVLLPDGREFDGQLVGSDPRSDLAVVKVDAEKLPVATLGNSDQLKPGQFCIAIGNPFGLQSTITFGVISALGRDIRAQQRKILQNLIQTDAPINPGNSGGPLINFEGKVIGINTAIIPYAQGIGFAIPINTAKEIISDLIEYGKVIRPWIGIYYLPITPQVKERFDLSVEQGIYIMEVASDSPAEKAGIRAGDAIVKVNDKKITSADDLREIISNKQVGDTLTFLLVREGKTMRVEVKLGEMPSR